MSKEKIKRENEKKDLDKKHAEELEAAQNAAKQKLAMGAVAGTVIAFVLALLMFAGGSSAPASATAGDMWTFDEKAS